jgi:hypothetical protein
MINKSKNGVAQSVSISMVNRLAGLKTVDVLTEFLYTVKTMRPNHKCIFDVSESQ